MKLNTGLRFCVRQGLAAGHSLNSSKPTRQDNYLPNPPLPFGR